MLKQKFQQKHLLKLSPQQIQLVKLLEVPVMDLQQRIKEELEINPALEEDESEAKDESLDNPLADEGGDEENSRDTDDFDFADYMDEDDVSSYKLKSNNYAAPEDAYERPISFSLGLQEQLMEQVGMLPLDEKQQVIAKVIVGNIDDDGYLKRDLYSLVNDLAFSYNLMTEEEDIQFVLKEIQGLEPAGVGARNLQECLTLQLQYAIQQNPPLDQLFTLNISLQILKDYFEEFTKKHYEKIKSKLNLSDEDFSDAIDEILALNPKPGGLVSDSTQTQTIIPDYYLTVQDGEFILTLHGDNDPNLKVNKSYQQMLQTMVAKNKRSDQDKEALKFVKQKIESAHWFMDMLVQRQHTLLFIMQAILEFQREYFLSGDISLLKPMILKDIAEPLGFDMSTVSRVTSNKYIQTPFGIFLLKHFFSNAMTNSEGEEVSTSEIKDVLMQLIQNEDKKCPLNDEAMVEELKKKGFNVARRTVAKYRENMGFPVARLRRGV